VTGADGVSEPAAAVIRALIARTQTLAVAESLTGGLVAATLVDVPGASAVFRGGLVVYATDLKATLAGVDADLLAERGPVDPDVAVQLAHGVRGRCGSDWGLATTGVAGPTEQNGIAVGTVFIGVAAPDGSAEVRALRIPAILGRSSIRRRTVDESLSWLTALLADVPSR
jgi:nicotinamide-nucleotide amidase